MEPFGLFQFLQNLLTPQSDLGENPPPQSAEISPKEPTAPPPKTDESPAQNAAAVFLENHERRARRRK